VTRRRNKAAAKKFLIKTMRKHGSPKIITTDKLPSYGAALREIGIADKQLCGGPVQQQMRKFAPAISTTRTSDAEV
ncbi:DDE-type integrase/transposase/recombinase, partial [bacterium]|nr:DDE-type integrase/transposase/recombinase [bacterium]